MPKFVLYASFFALALALSSTARAQDPDGRMAPRVMIAPHVGLFGDVRASAGNASTTDGLEPALGGAVGLELPVFRLLSMGIEVRGTAWSSERAERWGASPSLLLDVSFVPRLRIPWGSRTHESHGAVTLGAVIGPSFGFVSEDVQDGLSLLGGEADPGVGLHAGAVLGLQLFPVYGFGLMLEAGYIHHAVWHSVHLPGTTETVELDLGQLFVRAGVMFAF